jgi:hypothetical protein
MNTRTSNPLRYAFGQQRFQHRPEPIIDMQRLGHATPLASVRPLFATPAPDSRSDGVLKPLLSQLPGDQVKNTVAEFLLLGLYNHLMPLPQPRRLRRMLVLDEAWRVTNSEWLEPLVREGRALGLGIIVATQYPNDLAEAVAGATLSSWTSIRTRHGPTWTGRGRRTAASRSTSYGTTSRAIAWTSSSEDTCTRAIQDAVALSLVEETGNHLSLGYQGRMLRASGHPITAREVAQLALSKPNVKALLDAATSKRLVEAEQREIVAEVRLSEVDSRNVEVAVWTSFGAGS